MQGLQPTIFSFRFPHVSPRIPLRVISLVVAGWLTASCSSKCPHAYKHAVYPRKSKWQWAGYWVCQYRVVTDNLIGILFKGRSRASSKASCKATGSRECLTIRTFLTRALGSMKRRVYAPYCRNNIAC